MCGSRTFSRISTKVLDVVANPYDMIRVFAEDRTIKLVTYTQKLRADRADQRLYVSLRLALYSSQSQKLLGYKPDVAVHLDRYIFTS